MMMKNELKKVLLPVVAVILVMNLSGCFLFVAGAAGGAGTAVWLSGKLTQEFHSPYPDTLSATRSALKSLNLPANKETQEENMTQIKSTFSDGKEIWIDIHKVSDTSTRVDVRVGAVNPDKEADSMILKKIQSYL
jgi:hypothetical protein